MRYIILKKRLANLKHCTTHITKSLRVFSFSPYKKSSQFLVWFLTIKSNLYLYAIACFVSTSVILIFKAKQNMLFFFVIYQYDLHKINIYVLLYYIQTYYTNENY